MLSRGVRARTRTAEEPDKRQIRLRQTQRQPTKYPKPLIKRYKFIKGFVNKQFFNTNLILFRARFNVYFFHLKFLSLFFFHQFYQQFHLF